LPKVSQIMVTPALTIDASSSVLEAAKIMGEKRVGSLVVTEDSEPVGIFAEPDLVSKVIARKLEPSNTPVKDVMSTPLVTVDESTMMRDVIAIMAQKRIIRLPVTRRNKIVGIVTGREIIDFVSFFLESLK